MKRYLITHPRAVTAGVGLVLAAALTGTAVALTEPEHGAGRCGRPAPSATAGRGTDGCRVPPWEPVRPESGRR